MSNRETKQYWVIRANITTTADSTPASVMPRAKPPGSSQTYNQRNPTNRADCSTDRQTKKPWPRLLKEVEAKRDWELFPSKNKEDSQQLNSVWNHLTEKDHHTGHHWGREKYAEYIKIQLLMLNFPEFVSLLWHNAILFVRHTCSALAIMEPYARTAINRMFWVAGMYEMNSRDLRTWWGHNLAGITTLLRDIHNKTAYFQCHPKTKWLKALV